MTQTTFNDSVSIDGSTSTVQLEVQGHSNQDSNALQTWEDSSGTVLSQVSEDGRVEIGNAAVTGTAAALLEVNQDETQAGANSLRQGIQARGIVDGLVNVPLAWVVEELELRGTGGVSDIQAALRARIIQANTGDAASVELRAADLEARNEQGTQTTPVGQATGVRGAVVNAENAYLAKATGVEAGIHNDIGATITEAAAVEVAAPMNSGTIDKAYGVRVPDMTVGTSENYAIHTGAGKVHLGDIINFAGTMGDSTKNPTTDAPADWIEVQIAGVTKYIPVYDAS